MAKIRKQLLVVALGGNALLKKGDSGLVEEQEINAFEVCSKLTELFKRDYNLVITHGNGPQVGAILLQNEAAKEKVPAMPLDVCVALSQGSIGYILQQTILNALRSNGIKRYVVTMITQVLVDPDDSAFSNPTKPVGPFYKKEEADALIADKNWSMIEDSGRGFRRVVPSPLPKKIVQRIMIKKLAEEGHIVIAAGGGGVPIWKSSNHNDSYRGMEAVIDKDLASSLLASEINADMLLILTEVEAVYLNFGKSNQRPLDRLSTDEARKLLAEGQFGVGSMAPKIEGALSFVERTGKTALITSGDVLLDALEGRTGTLIYSKDTATLKGMELFQ